MAAKAPRTKLRSRVRVEGMEALQRKLGRLPDAVRNPVLKDAIVKAAKPVREDAAQRAPRGPTGKLQDEMTLGVMEGTPERAAVRIGPSPDAWYGELVEKGTKKMAAQPFLRPALDKNRRKIVQSVRADLKAALEREAARP